ncbi:MAG: hypothetical protein IPI30_21500 [Saprospiraceae bacterium]|nr:hypothetical protein [Candidatus Vicinibacter affinis]
MWDGAFVEYQRFVQPEQLPFTVEIQMPNGAACKGACTNLEALATVIPSRSSATGGCLVAKPVRTYGFAIPYRSDIRSSLQRVPPALWIPRISYTLLWMCQNIKSHT